MRTANGRKVRIVLWRCALKPGGRECSNRVPRRKHLATPAASARLIAGTPGAAGACYDARLEWEGIPAEFRCFLEQAELPASLTWCSRSSGARTTLRFDLEPDGDGATGVTATLAHGVPAFMRPLEPFSWALMTRLFERMMRKLHTLDAGSSV
jgi:hypothetical protein